MDFFVNHEKITSTKVLLDTTCEQSAEWDLILPDYYPDIFRILKCSFTPAVTSRSINGSRISFELTVNIKILYCSAENKKVNCVEQKQVFTKTLDINGDVQNPEIHLRPRTDYINCRVQNQRRLDIRGCVSTRVKVIGEETSELLIGASGGKIQLKREEVSVLKRRISFSKRITVSEEIELSEQKPDMDSMIKTSCDIDMTECKVIPDKMVVKGEAKAFVLYNTSDDSCDSLKFSLPFSNILDIDGADESFKVFTQIESPFIEIIPKSNSQREYTCEISFTVCVNAYKYDNEYLVLDAYSTAYECENEASQLNCELCPEDVSVRFDLTGTLKSDDARLSEVIDASAECYNVQYRTENDNLLVFGSIDISLMARDPDGCPLLLSDTLSFEKQLDTKADCISSIDLTAKICSVDYMIKSDDCAEITVSAEIDANVKKCLKSSVLKNISLNENSKKTCNPNCALKLYNCEENESLWDVAKRFNTSPSAIAQENDLTQSDSLPKAMLLIPITD